MSEEQETVIDSSALIAALYQEDDAEKCVKLDNACMSVINLAECLIVLNRNGMPLETAKRLLYSTVKRLMPCEFNDAALISEVKQKNGKIGLSLADCACIALGEKLGLPVITADRIWSKANSTTEITVIR